MPTSTATPDAQPAAAEAGMHSAAAAVPLTEAQEGLWYAQQLDPGNPLFNTGHCTEIRGPLDRARFSAAIGQTLAEADALALNFSDGDAGPRQWIDERRRPVLEQVALPASAEAAGHARQAMRQDLETPVDPRSAPLARYVLFSLGEERHFWYQRVHHLAADGYGMALIEGRALQLYRQLGAAQGAGKPLTPFQRVVADDAAYRASEQRQKDAAFWREQLCDIEAIGSLAEASAMSAHRILQARQNLPAETVALLQQRQAAAQCAWPAILTALVAAYVQRHTGGEAVVIGAPWMGRMGHASARCVATVMNVMPMRLALDQDTPLDEIFRRCAEQLALAHRHGRYRSEQLRRDLGLPGGQGRIHGPLVNILPFDAAYRRAGLDANQEVLCAGPVDDFNFNFRAAPDASDMRLELEANPRLYDARQVQQHLARLTAFLHAALQAQTLRPVQTLHGAEFRHWVYGVNQTGHAVPDTTLVALVAQTCARHPQAEALRAAGRSIDFAGFDALVGRAARRLQVAGVGRGDIVAVALPRSLEMVLSLHAVQRAGAAWLPLDIDQPAARSERILGVARPAALIGEPGTLAGLECACPAFTVASLFEPPDRAEPEPAALPEVQPGDAAYVIFTSGSTGEPKGVVVSHRAIVNRLLWMRDHYGLSADDCFLQKTPYTFDVSVWELFLPMLCAAPLVVAAPEVHRDPLALAELIRREGVDVVHFVPSMLAAFLDEPASRGLALRMVFCSGEALPARLRDRFHASLSAALHNLYGPTEAAVDVSWWSAANDDRSDPVPIGFPVWNTQLHVLDTCRRPLPAGVRGQLYLAGVQLADCYLGRPELTAARFVANPFSAQAGTRMYDTGDLARWRADGAVEYLGRVDHQVKLRGQRIELGEIEAVLGRHPLCRQLAVALRQDAAGEQRLIAYVVPPESRVAGQEAQDGQALLDYARQQLPPAMVPSAVVWLAALPLNRNGKLDSKALPAPDFASQAAVRSATTPGEIDVARAFQQILGLPAAPGADDDFFALGGHSLLAARLASALRRQTGANLTLGAVFEHPTVARLAAWLQHLAGDAEAGADAGFGPVFTLRAPSAGAPGALFCIHPASGLCWCYGPLARNLSGTRPVFGLQSPVLAGRQHGIGSLRELATQYADRLQALQAHGPYHLLGWSVGGIIAQDMACVLRERGAEVGIVALLDAYPSEVWRARPPAAADDAWRAILHIAGFDPAGLPDLELSRDGVIAFLRRRGHPLGALTDAQLHGILEAVAFNNALVRGHRQRRYDGELLYFRAALDHRADGLDPRAWQAWAAQLTVHDVPSLHGDLPGQPALDHWLPVLDARLRDTITPASEAPGP